MPESTLVQAINCRNLRRGSGMAMAGELELLPTHTIDHIEGQPECLLLADFVAEVGDYGFLVPGPVDLN
jgi:hypothetical protein